jgi:ATP-binding cassette subfamily C protein CydD
VSHPGVKAAVPRTVTVTLVLLAWVQAACLAGVFVAAGRAVDATDRGAPVLAMLLCGVGAAVCVFVESVLVARAQDGAERHLRGAVMDRLLTRSVSRPERDARVIPLATSSVERAAHYRAGFLAPILGSFTTPPGGVAGARAGGGLVSWQPGWRS